MSDALLTEIALQTMLVTAKLCAPVLLTTLVVGFVISLFQSVTQIQEVTLSFVPKLLASGVALLLTGSWMLAEVTSFTTHMFDQVPRLLGTL